MHLTTRQELLAHGHTDGAIRRLVDLGSILRVGRGRYALSFPDDPRQFHLAMAQFEDEGVLTLETAALVHGLPVARVPAAVQLVLDGQRNQLRGRWRQIRGEVLPEQDVVDVSGYTVTSVARTIVDLARLRGAEDAIITWEAALWRARESARLGELRQAVAEVLGRCRRRKGVVVARELARFASSFSESPQESRSRLALSKVALPDPVQQFIVLDFNGRTIGRADFAWPELGVLGEYDGQDKYDSLARPGESPAEVVRREKRRQEQLESMGWVVVRWGIEELRSPSQLRQRVDRALDTGRRRGLGGSLPGRLPTLDNLD
ncbi:hypothetical protein [Aestuariimicrobium sp. Y1814]|uniref:hypothetical protein n=1 Tax=Aestuariimicrobium sp. Y1814 TaxID=3418742 RepID=UPI003DA75BB5